MNRYIIFFLGFLFIVAGVATGVYVYQKDKQSENQSLISNRLKEGEELLQQSNKRSREKALFIFSELSAKNTNEEYKFRIRYGLAIALEKNKDRILALEIFKELNQYPNLTREQKEKVAYSLGNLLLILNQEEEGKVHLNFVLQSSNGKKIRSKSLSSIGDFHYRKKDYEKARKNYLLAIQEDPSNVHARIGWARTLRAMGLTPEKDWSSYDIFDDYIEHAFYQENPLPEVTKGNRTSSFNLGKYYFNKKQFYKAIQSFKKSLATNKNLETEEKIYYYLSESYFSVGNMQESLKYVGKVLENSIPVLME